MTAERLLAAAIDAREAAAYAEGRKDERAEWMPVLEALQLIAGTDPIDAALDPQRAIRVARAAIAHITGQEAS